MLPSHSPAQIRELIGKSDGTALRLSLSSLYSSVAMKEAREIHTLGPALTSSHLTALALVKYSGVPLDILLHQEFEDILARDFGEGALALVPSAYAGIDRFFMSERTSLVGCFCSDTPPYHLAWPKSSVNPLNTAKREICIASHPAPIGLIPRLLPHQFPYRVALYPSTVSSAQAVENGEADVALCNSSTIRQMNMDRSSSGITIHMSWNLFALQSES